MSSYASGPSITLDRDISADFSGGHTYEIILPKRTILLNQDSATIQHLLGMFPKLEEMKITEATVQGVVKTLYIAQQVQ